MDSRQRWILTGGLALVLGALALCVLVAFAIWGDQVLGRRGPVQERRYRDNGEMIYFTGVNSRGERIPFSGGPMWLYMHGGGCTACHGPDGRGGVPVMMLTKIPEDIRYSQLTQEHQDHPPFTDELIKRAIREGLDPAGEPLDPSMPHWRMSEEDLNDLLAFLKTLG